MVCWWWIQRNSWRWVAVSPDSVSLPVLVAKEKPISFVPTVLALLAVTSPALVISDHRVLETSAGIPVPRPFRGVVPKGPKFSCPDDCSTDDWRNKLSAAWIQAKVQLSLDHSFSRTRKSRFKPNGINFRPLCSFVFWLLSRVRHKGGIAKARLESVPARGVFVHMRERKLRPQLAQPA